MNKKFKIINLISNSLVFLLVIVAIILMIVTAKHGEHELTASDVEMLKFFTVQSNLFIGAASLLSIIFILLNKMPVWVSIIKMLATITVTITFLTVMLYLGPVFGMSLMLQNANLFMHLIIPVIAIVHFILIEPQFEKYDFRYNFFGLIPVFLYGVAYFTNVAVNNGYGNYKYDWYYFGYFSLGIGAAMFVGMLAFTFLVSIGLYFGNKKLNLQKNSSK